VTEPQDGRRRRTRPVRAASAARRVHSCPTRLSMLRSTAAEARQHLRGGAGTACCVGAPRQPEAGGRHKSRTSHCTPDCGHEPRAHSAHTRPRTQVLLVLGVLRLCEVHAELLGDLGDLPGRTREACGRGRTTMGRKEGGAPGMKDGRTADPGAAEPSRSHGRRHSTRQKAVRTSNAFAAAKGAAARTHRSSAGGTPARTRRPARTSRARGRA
jgi:hypothetical protein